MTFSALVKKPYFVIKANWFVWSTFANRTAQQLLRKHPVTLTALQERIVRELEETGIATVPLTELAPGGPTLEALRAYASSHEQTADVKTKKQFLKYYWGTDEALDLENPFTLFSLSPVVLDIANAYMGMWTRFKHYTLNMTLPVPESEAPTHSQRWHRDPQEKRMLKMFIYLSDVDEGSGPFTYVLGSTHGKKYGALFPQQPPEGSYPSFEAIEKTIDPKDRRVMTAPAGTVIFCDTTGLHRGGYATKNSRLMFTAFFAAPSYVDRPWYTLTPELKDRSFTPSVRYALDLD